MKILKYILIFACSSLVTDFSFASSQNKTYTVGVVSQFETRRIIKVWQPVLDYIGKISNTRLILKPSSSISFFEQQFSNGDFDIAYMNPYHLIVANEKQGYLPILKDVDSELFGIIVVKKNSPLVSVVQLNGKSVAFPAPNALGAALIPRYEFSKKLNIKVKESYVNSHSSVYLNVVLGITDAGGGVQKTLSRQPKEISDQLRVLYKTQMVSPHPIAVHPRVPEEVRNRITKAFLQLGASPEGKALLAKIPFKKIGPATMKDYEMLRTMGLSDFYVE